MITNEIISTDQGKKSKKSLKISKRMVLLKLQKNLKKSYKNRKIDKLVYNGLVSVKKLSNYICKVSL